MLADDALEVHCNDLLEQQSSITFDVVDVKNSRPLPPKQFPQSCLTLDEWQCPQILSVEIQQSNAMNADGGASRETRDGQRHQRKQSSPSSTFSMRRCSAIHAARSCRSRFTLSDRSRRRSVKA